MPDGPSLGRFSLWGWKDPSETGQGDLTHMLLPLCSASKVAQPGGEDGGVGGDRAQPYPSSAMPPAKLEMPQNINLQPRGLLRER